MYQAWVIQKFNGELMNVVLGEKFATIDDAYRTICLYEEHFGKCELATIDVSGTPIPVAPREKKESFKDKLLDWFR